MSGWLSQFKLGIPGSELTFDRNPNTVRMVEGPVSIINENLAADLRKDIIKNFRPVYILNSNLLTVAQKNQFVSLCGMPSFLSFQDRDDSIFMEQDTPDDSSHITIRSNSITLLDKALNDIGGAANLTITGVFTNAAGTGTNYFTGGSYARATRIITLGTPLPSLADAFVQYSYLGWLCNIQAISSTGLGGNVDMLSYDFQIEGA